MSCCETIYLDFTLYPILLVTIRTPSVVPPHTLYMNNVVYQCSVRLYVQLFVGWLITLFVICVFLCIVVCNTFCVVFFVLFVFVLCTLSCQFLWIVHL
jgi:hypothetical protein